MTGTARPDREPAVPDHVPAGPMIAPPDLTEQELLYFADLVGMLQDQKRASPHHVIAVTLLARRLAEIEMLQAVISIEGITARSRSTKGAGKEKIVTEMIRARPEVAMKSEAMRHAQSLLGELMLTPLSSLKIAAGKQPEDNPFGGF